MKNPDKKIIEEILSDYQKSVARLVLFCLNEIPEAQGIKKTIVTCPEIGLQKSKLKTGL
jgi:hypothetical protein